MRKKHCIHFHHYADDLQYAHFDLNKSSLESTISRMHDCICDVQSWFTTNKLKRNPEKTLRIDFVPPYCITLVDNINIKIGSSDINAVSSVTNLGVPLVRNLKMTAQTSHLMSSCAYQLKLVNSIRASLDVQVAERVVTQSLHPDWTTAIHCWLALQYRILPACKDYRTPLLDVY